MKVYLSDNIKLTKFTLPTTSDNFFTYDYKVASTNINCLVTFEKMDEKWYIKSNGIVTVYSGSKAVTNAEITEYSSYKLKIIGYPSLVSIFFSTFGDENTYQLSVENCNKIIIGSGANCNINYSNQDVAQAQVALIKDAAGWIISGIEDTKYFTYLNDYRIIRKKIKLGDIIFINGLKIIWMQNFIIINNPSNRVKIIGLNKYTNNQMVDNSKVSPVSDEEQNVKLYSDDEYFFHMPRINEIPEPATITIQAPPVGSEEEDMPWILTIGSSLTMVASSFVMGWSVVSGLTTGSRTVVQAIPQIVMCVTMIVGSLILPKFLAKYKKKQAQKKEEKRVTKFTEYLDKKEEKITTAMKQESQIMYNNSLSASACKSLTKNNRFFWSREIKDDDFLTVRVGIGNIDNPVSIETPAETFTLDEDGLLDRVLNISKKYEKLNDVPINLSLTEKNISAFVCNDNLKNIYMANILCQLITLHSGNDLKIAIFTNEYNAQNWEFAKYLPHCWNEEKDKRFFATNVEEVKEISNYLSDIFKVRKEMIDNNKDENGENVNLKNGYKDIDTYYLIICDNYKNNMNVSIFNDILSNSDVNYGFSFLIATNTLKNLPSNCNTFVEVGEKEGCILDRHISSKNQRFKIECDTTFDLREISNRLLNIPLVTKEGLEVLPQSISFLEMYGVSKIEQLNILNRWKTNNPVTSLTAPIGVYANGDQFKLNLHEKFHGPHGLIAGMTGSGKSEFIITYILSMCVNYHPNEVQFVLIDYKGGGLAGAFENKETHVRIPHLVGTITNLDTSEMNRTLVSIESELKRRQRVFNEVKDMLGESTIDIYKYQKFYREGLIKEPMAHLFIISDEFAELKSQQPEFLQQLVSAARIGRSLGVHLILATQKPTGVVNDQIWSNSKFKVCLKVQDRGDSNEMLKKPDAASIKETGRFYLQVGYDDFFDKGQSGWAGAKYTPSDTITKKIDDSIEFINNIGEITYTAKDLVVKQNDTEDLGDQLTNIVKNIYELGKKEDIHTKNLWLDSIPEQIYVEDLKTKYSYQPVPYEINPVIGEYDKPSAQEQGLLNVNLTKGNLVVWGQSGSGKENLLSTIIWSSSIEHTPEEVNFYLIDCGTESLKSFSKMPSVGDIATLEETEKIMNILVYVEEELLRRKELMADFGGSYKSYIENSGEKLPLIVCIINNYEIFNETYGRINDSIQTLFRDGSKYGVIFIVTAIATNAVKSRSLQYFENKICLQIPNESEYRSCVDAPKGLFPAKLFGRGIVKREDDSVEFQTAMFCEKNNMAKTVIAKGEELFEKYGIRAKKIPTVPPIVNASLLTNEINGLANIPIGYTMNTKEPLVINFKDKKINNIISTSLTKKELTFSKVLIDNLLTLDDSEITIIDFYSTFKALYGDKNYYFDNFDNVFAQLNNKIINEKDNEKNNVIIIIGPGQMYSKLSEQGKLIVNNMFNNLSNIDNAHFIFIDMYNSIRLIQTEAWYQTVVDKSSGIWLGNDITSQSLINVNDVSLEDRKNIFDYMAFYVDKGNYTVFKHVVADEVGQDE